jgi:hypothetical protein
MTLAMLMAMEMVSGLDLLKVMMDFLYFYCE